MVLSKNLSFIKSRLDRDKKIHFYFMLKCCELLHSFKCDMLEDYEYAMQNNKLNRQRPQTIRRKTARAEGTFVLLNGVDKPVKVKYYD